MLVTLVVRQHTFAPQELGLDGALSMDLARSPLQEMLAFNALDVHPPLFYAALKLWMLPAGAGYFTVKYLVVLYGVLATALLGAVASWLFSPRVALLAAPLFVLAPTGVLLGPAVRDFTPGMALSLCCLLFTLSASTSDSVARGGRLPMGSLLAGLSLATAAALLTWYFHIVFLLLTMGIALVWGGRRRIALLGTLLVGCVLASPWYGYAVPSLLSKVGQGTTAYGGSPHMPPLGSLPHALAHGLTGIDGQPWGSVSLAAWLAAIIMGAAATMTGLVSSSRMPSRMLGISGRDYPNRSSGEEATGGYQSPMPTSPVGGYPLTGVAPALRVDQAPMDFVKPGGRRDTPDVDGASREVRRSLEARTASRPGKIAKDGVADARLKSSYVRATGVALAGLVLGAATVAGLAARWNASDDLARYVFVLVPFAAMVQAAGAATRLPWQRIIGLSMVLALLAAQEGSFVRLVTGTPIDWNHDPAVAQVRQSMRPGDAVIFNDRARRLRFDLGPHAGVVDFVVHSAGQRYLQSNMARDTERILAEALPTSQRIWYLNAGDPPNTPPIVREALASSAYLARHEVVDGSDLSLFDVGVPDGDVAPKATFGSQALLRTARYSRTASPGGAALVELTWDCLQRFDQPYSVFVHLEAPDGHLVAQHDGEPVAGFAPTTAWQPGTSVVDRHGVSLTPDTPLGTYRLYVGLYRGDARLRLPDHNNQLLLGEISVVAHRS